MPPRRRTKLSRRELGGSLLALAASPWLLRTRRVNAQAQVALGKPAPFSFDALIESARARALTAYEPARRPARELVERIDHQAHARIRFRPEHALFAARGPYPVTFFHLGRLFDSAVKVHALADGMAREVLYSPNDFSMPARSPARRLPKDVGFAGFRVQESLRRADHRTHDWLVFLGASYFRAIGEQEQYGLSARGIALNTTAPDVGEEFPDFTEFYIEEPASEELPLMIYARLEGPSVSGAYKFTCHRTRAVVMEVEAHVFARSDIAQLGVAPLTSMFWFAEYDRCARSDWRPEVHDSDGLAIWNGRGERLFRPLNNPRRVITSSFVDDSPKGFGLVQRDREFEHYLDGVRYDRRPSLWVEPLSPLGAGAVQLVEIPTDDEIHHNIVAFWNPAQKVKRGDALMLQYRLHWTADEPYPPQDLSRVFATRIGRGGRPGEPHPEGVTKFVIEFAGASLDALPQGTLPKVQVHASHGHVAHAFVERVPTTARFRAQFDLALKHREELVELRLHLHDRGRPLTESWLYQFDPRAA